MAGPASVFSSWFWLHIIPRCSGNCFLDTGSLVSTRRMTMICVRPSDNEAEGHSSGPCLRLSGAERLTLCFHTGNVQPMHSDQEQIDFVFLQLFTDPLSLLGAQVSPAAGSISLHATGFRPQHRRLIFRGRRGLPSPDTPSGSFSMFLDEKSLSVYSQKYR